MKLIIALIVLAGMGNLFAADPAPIWYWDCESDVINISASRDSIIYGGTAAAALTTAEAYAGNSSSHVDLPWSKASDIHLGLKDVFCPVNEGTIEMMWKNIGPADGTPMLFMLHCKWKTNPDQDTNDGLALYYRGGGEFRLYYNRHSLGSVFHRIRNVPVVTGQWHRIRVRYKVGYGMSFQLDDMEPKLFEHDMGRTVADHWFCMLWGNDTHSTCNFYMDELKLYDTWTEDESGQTRISLLSPAAVQQQEGLGVLLNILGRKMTRSMLQPGIYLSYSSEGVPLKTIRFNK